MKTHALFVILAALISTGCVVLPEKDVDHSNKCEISSDKKTLRIVDLAKEINGYYSLSGMMLVPITGIVSGVYVAVNNVYHLGEELIVCD